VDYIRFFKPRIVEYVERQSAPPASIRELVSGFLTAHAIRISDPEVLRELDYQVRAELQNRRLRAYLKQSRVS